MHSNEQRRSFKIVYFICSLLTNKLQQITTLALATILIAGSFSLMPFAYSTGWNHDDDDDDKKIKICHIPPGNPNNAHSITISKAAWDAHSMHGDHKGECENDHDDGEDCKCKKPTIFTIRYNGPGILGGTGSTAPVTIEIYKNTGDIGKKTPLLTIPDISDGNSVAVNSNMFGKQQLEANTIYRVMQGGMQIAVVSIQTSCSQPLFIGNFYTNNSVKLTVESGIDSTGKQSIFLEHDPICEGVTLTVTKILEPRENLGKFILQIDGQSKTGPIGDSESTGPIVLMPGVHTVDEIAVLPAKLDDYVRTVGGDCKSDGTINLKKGEKAECIITNTVKKPATITLKKALMNDNGVLATPDDFQVTMFDVGSNGQPGGGDDVQKAQGNFDTIGMIEFEIPAGIYSLNEAITDSEIAANSYNTVLITGDDACPQMEEEAFTLNEGDHITCTIYNNDNFVEGGAAGPSPTVTLKIKVIDRDLGVTETSPPSFQVDGQPVSLNMQITLVANEATEITQTNDNVPGDGDENNEVLPTKITGDGHCPEVLAGTITLSSGQDIECVFEYGKEIEPGVIFHHDTQMVGKNDVTKLQDPDVGTPCGEVVPFLSGGVDQGFFRYENTATQGPCIAINGGEIWVVPDPTVTLTDTTIVLFTVIITGSDVVTQIDPLATTCIFNGLAPTLDQIDDDNPTVESTPLAFRLRCTDLPDEGNWNVNYALIETDPLA